MVHTLTSQVKATRPSNTELMEGYVDYDEIRALAQEHQPKMIIAGFGAYSQVLDFAKFREIADEVGAYLLVDMAHIAGLLRQVNTPVRTLRRRGYDNNTQNFARSPQWFDLPVPTLKLKRS